MKHQLSSRADCKGSPFDGSILSGVIELRYKEAFCTVGLDVCMEDLPPKGHLCLPSIPTP